MRTAIAGYTVGQNLVQADKNLDCNSQKGPDRRSGRHFCSPHLGSSSLIGQQFQVISPLIGYEIEEIDNVLHGLHLQPLPNL